MERGRAAPEHDGVIPQEYLHITDSIAQPLLDGSLKPFEPWNLIHGSTHREGKQQSKAW